MALQNTRNPVCGDTEVGWLCRTRETLFVETLRLAVQNTKKSVEALNYSDLFYFYVGTGEINVAS